MVHIKKKKRNSAFPWYYIFFSEVTRIWGSTCAGIHCMAWPHTLLSLETWSPHDRLAWPLTRDATGSHHVPIRSGEERLGGETASRLQAKGRLYPGGRTAVLSHFHFLYIWKLRGTEAFIPGIPKLEWVSGFTGSADRGQKVPLTNRARCPPPHQAPPKPLLKKGERGDLPTHTGPVSSGLSDHLA